MVKIRHSCGTSRNLDSNSPTKIFGYSTSAVTSSRRSASSIGESWPDRFNAFSLRLFSIKTFLSSKETMTEPSVLI